MDVAADDSIEAGLPRLLRKALLEAADEGAGLLHLQLDRPRERVVRQAERRSQGVPPSVHPKQPAVSDRTELREERRVAHHEIELVAVGDEQAPAVGGLVQGGQLEPDAAELHARELPCRVVVVARDVGDLGAALGKLEQATDDTVVLGRPVPAGLETPHVDDVADEVEAIALDLLEESREILGPAAGRAEVGVADPDRPEAGSHRRLRADRQGSALRPAFAAQVRCGSRERCANGDRVRCRRRRHLRRRRSDARTDSTTAVGRIEAPSDRGAIPRRSASRVRDATAKNTPRPAKGLGGRVPDESQVIASAIRRRRPR